MQASDEKTVASLKDAILTNRRYVRAIADPKEKENSSKEVKKVSKGVVKKATRKAAKENVANAASTTAIPKKRN